MEEVLNNVFTFAACEAKTEEQVMKDVADEDQIPMQALKDAFANCIMSNIQGIDVNATTMTEAQLAEVSKTLFLLFEQVIRPLQED